ncbi:spermine oxidase-like isoform X2 [Frankliniella occidentalis]|uniref:Spermine oxidase-like isoform X2 n=1 Tax=Frankliniella occidentalis TaxID=133901 RepID=A0A6J1SDP0_FRAOC|nr:spermine oxidase-like isoform X2 [Frankliniella occidentalis]
MPNAPPRSRRSQQCMQYGLCLFLLALLSPVGALPPSADGAPTNHSRVLIVGAGAAGYAAAARLLEHGWSDFTILEAEPRIGGRIHSVREAGTILEMGAEWVHGENVVYEMAAPLQLLGRRWSDSDAEVSVVWSGGVEADIEDVMLLYNTSIDIHDAGAHGELANYNGSFGEWFLEKFNKRLQSLDRRPPPDLVEAFLDAYQKGVGLEEGAHSWNELSGRGMTEYEESRGENEGLFWKRDGFISVFDLLTKRFPNSSQELPVRQRVLLDSEVSAIRWGERVRSELPAPPVVVELSHGGKHTADIVLVTVSLGVLKHRDIFDPPLPPRKMKAVENLGFGTVEKVFLHFTEPWWPSDVAGYEPLVREEDRETFKREHPEFAAHGEWAHALSAFYVDQHAPRSAVLSTWITGEPARLMESYTDSELMMGCVKWLQMFVGQNLTIPQPAGFRRSSWWSNPHFKGSFSYISLDSDRADVRAAHLAEPILDAHDQLAILFAGEATHGRHYTSVHGAIESGQREADRILKEYKKK